MTPLFFMWVHCILFELSWIPDDYKNILLSFLMSHFPSSEETGLGLLTHAETLQAVQKVINTKQISSIYVKYSPSKLFKIGKYASENGSTNAVPKFQNEFPTSEESTIREF